METAPPQPPCPAPACVNFSNICFPWALVGLGWEGREFRRLPEAALSLFHPCRLSSAEEATSTLPRGSGRQGLPLRPGGQASPPSDFPWDLPLGTGALLAQGAPLRAGASTGPWGQA